MSRLSALALSFHSEAFYRDVARRWTGTGFLYMAALLAASWVVSAARADLEMRAFRRQLDQEILPSFPKVELSGGKLSLDPPQRFSLRDGKGRALLIVDPAADPAELDGVKHDVLMIGRDAAAVHAGGSGETLLFPLSGVPDYVVDREKLRAWSRWLDWLSAPVIYPVGLTFSLATRTPFVLLFAILGMAFGATRALGFLPLCRLAAVSITPSVLVQTAAAAIGWQPPLWILIVLLLEAGYLWWAVRAALRPEAA